MVTLPAPWMVRVDPDTVMMDVSLLSKVTGNPEDAEALAVILATLVLESAIAAKVIV